MGARIDLADRLCRAIAAWQETFIVTAFRDRRARVAALLAAAAAAVLVLTGCAAESPVAAVDFGDPADITEPGTELSFGDAAWIELIPALDDGLDTDDTDPSTPVFRSPVAGLSVLQVRQLDPASIPNFTQTPELKGMVPWAIVTQTTVDPEILAGEEEPPQLDVVPTLADGGTAQTLMADVGAGVAPATCPIDLPEWTAGEGTIVRCIIGLTNTVPIVGALYNSLANATIVAEIDSPLIDNPIIWK